MRDDEFERGVQYGIYLARRQERSYVDGWRAGAAAAFDALGIEKDERLMVLVRQGPRYVWDDCAASDARVEKLNELFPVLEGREGESK